MSERDSQNSYIISCAEHEGSVVVTTMNLHNVAGQALAIQKRCLGKYHGQCPPECAIRMWLDKNRGNN